MPEREIAKSIMTEAAARQLLQSCLPGSTISAKNGITTITLASANGGKLVLEGKSPQFSRSLHYIEIMWQGAEGDRFVRGGKPHSTVERVTRIDFYDKSIDVADGNAQYRLLPPRAAEGWLRMEEGGMRQIFSEQKDWARENFLPLLLKGLENAGFDLSAVEGKEKAVQKRVEQALIGMELEFLSPGRQGNMAAFTGNRADFTFNPDFFLKEIGSLPGAEGRHLQSFSGTSWCMRLCIP